MNTKNEAKLALSLARKALKINGSAGIVENSITFVAISDDTSVIPIGMPYIPGADNIYIIYKNTYLTNDNYIISGSNIILSGWALNIGEQLLITVRTIKENNG